MKEEKSYPLISIVIPIYNSARFLRKSIPSVMAQEYPNLEIVLLNNGSTDESASIIEEYANQDERINVYTIEHVGTPKESRDNAIYRAKGDWIIAVDSDDSIEPGYVEKLWKRHKETDADCVCGGMMFVDDEANEINAIPETSFDKNQVWNGTEAMLHTLYEWEIGINGALIQKDLYASTNILMNSTRTFYTDECDTRIILNHCEKVAFSDAQYLYYYNTTSTGKRLSITSILYDLVTMLGLYEYFGKVYGEGSILTQGCFRKLHWDFGYSLKKIIRNRSLIKSQINESNRKSIEDAFYILKAKRNSIGKYRWYKDKLLYILYSKII